MSVSALVTGIAASHYYYMRKVWVLSGESPIIYRYIDWFLTVPLQIIEFYLILSVAKKIPKELFYKLLLASFFMILFGFLGETGQIDRNLGFVLGTIALEKPKIIEKLCKKYPGRIAVGIDAKKGMVATEG